MTTLDASDRAATPAAELQLGRRSLARRSRPRSRSARRSACQRSCCSPSSRSSARSVLPVFGGAPASGRPSSRSSRSSCCSATCMRTCRRRGSRAHRRRAPPRPGGRSRSPCDRPTARRLAAPRRRPDAPEPRRDARGAHRAGGVRPDGDDPADVLVVRPRPARGRCIRVRRRPVLALCAEQRRVVRRAARLPVLSWSRRSVCRTQRALWIAGGVRRCSACSWWRSRSQATRLAGARPAMPTRGTDLARSGGRRSTRRPARAASLARRSPAVPAGLLSAVTNHVTTDLISAPLLWVVPLAIYLASFVIAFSARAATASRSRSSLAPAALTLLWVPLGARRPVADRAAPRGRVPRARIWRSRSTGVSRWTARRPTT